MEISKENHNRWLYPHELSILMQGKSDTYSNGTKIFSDLYHFSKMYKIFVYKLGIYIFTEFQP